MVSGNLNMASTLLKPVAAGVFILCCHHAVFAADSARSGFYTIVGPDGQMIVIDRNAASTSAKKAASTNQSDAEKATKRSKWSLFGGRSENQNKTNPADQPLVGGSAQKSAPDASSSLPAQLPTPRPATQQAVIDAHKSSSLDSKTDSAPVQAVIDKKQTSSPSSIFTAQQLSLAKPLPEANQSSTLDSTQNQSAPIQASIPDSDKTDSKPITVIDGEEYIDTEYLEQREFNLEGRKRFYNLPDGLGGHEVLAREKGVDMTVFRQQKIDKPQVVDLAKNYQRIPQSQIIALTGTACFSNKQLKNAKLLKADETLDFWPKPGFEPKFDFIVAKLAQPISDLQVTSYANTTSLPKFYWPLPVFLDGQGCILEGVNAFYQTTLAATPVMHQGLQGYLHIPQNTQYILFTPLEAAADLSETQLTDKGQVRLTPIR
ncbi:MAG: putative pilus assembly protein FilE [Moraxellaceae bacterium]|nr:MAG: putative pilus assembly protein FilE [Moraxellaceae bacterium]